MKESPSNVSAETNKETSDIEALTHEEFGMLKEIGDGVHKIVQKLHGEIVRGEYGVIIGEDVSGRLPTMMLGNVISTLSKSYGHKAPLMRFVAGSTGLKRDQMNAKLSLLEEQMEQIKKDMEREFGIDKKVLLSTEMIDTGQSMGILANAARNTGLKADVATIGFPAALLPFVKQFLKVQWGANVVHGSLKEPELAKNGRALTGIRKNPAELFSTRRRKISGQTENAEVRNTITAAKAHAAHKEMRRISDEIVQSFLERKTNSSLPSADVWH